MEKAMSHGDVIAETEARIAYFVPAINVQKGSPKHVGSLADLTHAALTQAEETARGCRARPRKRRRARKPPPVDAPSGACFAPPVFLSDPLSRERGLRVSCRFSNLVATLVSLPRLTQKKSLQSGTMPS
jgi:hypothetical protein